MTTEKTLLNTSKATKAFIERLVELANDSELAPPSIVSVFGLFGKMAIDRSVETEDAKQQARDLLIRAFTHGLTYGPKTACTSAGIMPPRESAGSDPLPHGDRIAKLAATMAGTLIAAEVEQSQYGLEWQDIAFASLLALRSIALMKTGDETEADAALQVIIELAMRQAVVAKRFKSEAEMQAWAAQAGLEEGYGVDVPGPDAPSGPLH